MTHSAFTKFLILTITLLGFCGTALAMGANATPRIMVTGQGSANVAPDMAILSLTVKRDAESAREALDANNAAMAKVLKAMRDEGIEKRDLQTSGFSIYPRYAHQKLVKTGEYHTPKIVGYTVSNNLTVRVRDIDDVGKVLDKSVTLGVNEGGNIHFTNSDPSAAIEQARKEAVRQAMDKANTLASSAGVKTGQLLEMSEHSRNPPPAPMMAESMNAARSFKTVPIAAGENTYSVTVNMTYAIVQ